MRTASIPARAPAVPLRSRRLLALAGDARLVEQVRRGNEAAFEVIFERHGPAILAFCRHMLGTREEAEDAVQHSFAAAYRDLQRGGDRDIALKAWLFAIARNRCLSVLRACREVPTAVDALESRSPSGTGLAEQVEERADLRHLLADVRELPHDQRAALLLTELGDLSHNEVAGVLGCEVSRVKGLVFRARSALIARREARETPCESIREQLANLRGGSLRRSELRLHVRECPGCRSYREQVRQQRRMLAAALPVAPTLGLKSSVLAAVGIGGGSAGGLTAAAGGLGGATVAKVAVAGVLAGGGVVAGTAVVESERPAAPPSTATQQVDGADPPAGSAADGAAPGAGERGRTYAAERGAGGDGRGADRTGKRALEQTPRGNGRGPIDHATKVTPVKRGPPAKPWKAERGANAVPQGQARGHAKGAPGPKAGAKRGPRANGHTKPAGEPNGSAKPNPKPAPGAGSKTGGGSKAGAQSRAGAQSKSGAGSKSGARSDAGGRSNGGTTSRRSAPAGSVNRLAQPPPVPKAEANAIAPLGSVGPNGPAAHD
jgi:RNA polymerase sigma factor (sigma-70 family)